jgi:hypothetical protein
MRTYTERKERDGSPERASTNKISVKGPFKCSFPRAKCALISLLPLVLSRPRSQQPHPSPYICGTFPRPALKKDATLSSETFVKIYQTTWRHISAVRNLNLAYLWFAALWCKRDPKFREDVVTDFLDIVYRPVLLFKKNVSETGLCLRRQVIDLLSLAQSIEIALVSGHKNQHKAGYTRT